MKFEGIINGTKYDDILNFNKAMEAALENEKYSISYSIVRGEETPAEEKPIKTSFSMTPGVEGENEKNLFEPYRGITDKAFHEKLFDMAGPISVVIQNMGQNELGGWFSKYNEILEYLGGLKASMERTNNSNVKSIEDLNKEIAELQQDIKRLQNETFSLNKDKRILNGWEAFYKGVTDVIKDKLEEEGKKKDHEDRTKLIQDRRALQRLVHEIFGE